MIQAESLSSQVSNTASTRSLLRNCAARFFCACMGVTLRLRKERGLSAGSLTWNKMQFAKGSIDSWDEACMDRDELTAMAYETITHADSAKH